jgi:hypothetical protein
MGKAMDTFRNTLLWTYGRGTWQYDLICALILAFIFLTPVSFFNAKSVPTKRESAIQQPQQADPAAQSDEPGKDQQQAKP